MSNSLPGLDEDINSDLNQKHSDTVTPLVYYLLYVLIFALSIIVIVLGWYIWQQSRSAPIQIGSEISALEEMSDPQLAEPSKVIGMGGDLKTIVTTSPTATPDVMYDFEKINVALASNSLWQKVSLENTELSRQAVFIDNEGIDLAGTEWVAYTTIENSEDLSKDILIYEDVSTSIFQADKKHGWSAGTIHVGEHTLTPMIADGPMGSIEGFMRVSGDRFQVIITTNRPSGVTNMSEMSNLQFPYTREYRVFISDPISISQLLKQ